MPVPTFGYSVGDVISTITWICTFVSALRSHEAAEEFAVVQRELFSIRLTLEAVSKLSSTLFQSQNLYNSVLSHIEALKVPLDAFSKQLGKYEPVLGAAADPFTWRKMVHKSGWIIGGKNFLWFTGMKKDIASIRAVITTHQGSIELLMIAALGDVVNQQGQDTKETIESSEKRSSLLLTSMLRKTNDKMHKSLAYQGQILSKLARVEAKVLDMFRTFESKEKAEDLHATGETTHWNDDSRRTEIAPGLPVSIPGSTISEVFVSVIPSQQSNGEGDSISRTIEHCVSLDCQASVVGGSGTEDNVEHLATNLQLFSELPFYVNGLIETYPEAYLRVFRELPFAEEEAPTVNPMSNEPDWIELGCKRANYVPVVRILLSLALGGWPSVYRIINT
ncbi:hypothetical protein V8E51_003511 [Hyaloscypha variabilis]